MFVNLFVEWLCDGVCIGIVGLLNVGKLIFFNVLIGWEVVIVLFIVGMMCDVIEIFVNFGGVFIVFVDMVGLCVMIDDLIEVIGIVCVEDVIGCSDLFFWFGDLVDVLFGDYVLCIVIKSDLK